MQSADGELWNYETAINNCIEIVIVLRNIRCLYCCMDNDKSQFREKCLQTQENFI